MSPNRTNTAVTGRGYHSQSSDTDTTLTKRYLLNRRASPPLENYKIGHDSFILGTWNATQSHQHCSDRYRIQQSIVWYGHNAHQKLSSQSQGIAAPWKLQIGHDSFILGTWNVTRSHQHCIVTSIGYDSQSSMSHNAHQKVSSQSQGITAPWKLRQFYTGHVKCHPIAPTLQWQIPFVVPIQHRLSTESPGNERMAENF